MTYNKNKKIPLFLPYISNSARKAVSRTFDTRWIGSGPQVAQFEKLWEKKISTTHQAVAVNSCTSALHLAYVLTGIGEGDEVITPVFTFPATNIPLLYQKAKIVFSDVKKDSLNIDPEDVSRKITSKTKAIVVVHYGGVPCDMDAIQSIAYKHHLTVIEDAAHATGVLYHDRYIGSISDFTCFSFQAVKLITTGAGGMLTIKDPSLVDRAKRLRWYGAKKSSSADRWENGISEIGYQYEMIDITASMGITALKRLEKTIDHQQKLVRAYQKGIANIPGITYIGGIYSCIILADDRDALQKRLTANGIENSLVDMRNDRFAIFGGKVTDCPNMDALENKYLVLPMHQHLTVNDVTYICEIMHHGK